MCIFEQTNSQLTSGAICYLCFMTGGGSGGVITTSLKIGPRMKAYEGSESQFIWTLGWMDARIQRLGLTHFPLDQMN
jgi:hypothetical protein